LNDRGKLGDTAHGQSKQETHACVPGKMPAPANPKRPGT
jgi:hypothetical protein